MKRCGYFVAIEKSLIQHLGNHIPHTLAETGRYLVGYAGLLLTEVVLVARKSQTNSVRWIYLDIGPFRGLAETETETIKYTLVTPHHSKLVGAAVLAGPTCNSFDISCKRDG